MRDYHETDPEFAERFDHFAFDEVVNEEGQTLEPVTRHIAIVATLMGCQGIDEFRTEVPRALDAGLTPVMLKEIVYQGVDYLGIGRVRPFLDATNEILESRGVELPLEGQVTTTTDDRLERGVWLAANCFGDYHTRTGLDLAQREMITFCFLSAQGGCEPQLTAHSIGNMMAGNDAAFLRKVVSQCLPYIGYPRSLNAMACIIKAEEQMRG